MATGGISNDNYVDNDTAQIHLDHGTFPRTTPSDNRQSEPIITEATSTGVAKHNVGLQSLTGAIFIALLGGFLLCIASYGSVAWSKDSSDSQSKEMLGLWEKCECSQQGVPDEDWFRATQAMISIGVFSYVVTLAFLMLYMCSCITCFKKTTLLIMVMIAAFVTALFLLIGLIVFGVHDTTRDPAWAYIVCFVSTFVAIIAGSMSIMQYFRAKKTN